MMVFGMFFPLGETPYGAIPFYLVIGWCASPLLAHESNESRGTLAPVCKISRHESQQRNCGCIVIIA